MIIILTSAAVLDCVIGNDLFDFQVGYCFTWLTVLYSIGAYINKYQINSVSSMLPANRCGKGYLIASIGGFIVSIIIELILYNFTGKIKGERFFNQYTSPIVVFASIMLFLFFVNLKIREDVLLVNVVGKIRKNVFSVFILHNHPIIIDLFMARFEMFNDILPIFEFLIIPVAAIIIFTACIIIDRIREGIFNMLGMQNLTSWIGKKIKLDGTLEI